MNNFSTEQLRCLLLHYLLCVDCYSHLNELKGFSKYSSKTLNRKQWSLALITTEYVYVYMCCVYIYIQHVFAIYIVKMLRDIHRYIQNDIWGHSKSTFAQDLQVLTPPCLLSCSFFFVPFWLELSLSHSVAILVKFREVKLIVSTSIFG